MSKIEKIAVNGHYVWVDKNAEIVAWYLQANTDIICKASEPNTPKEWGNQIIAASPELNLEGVPSYVEVGWEDKTMSNDRKEWFKSQIGKTIWRTKSSCDCSICESAYTKGVYVLNEEHAIYIYLFEDDRLVDRYFATKEERDEFEKSKVK